MRRSRWIPLTAIVLFATLVGAQSPAPMPEGWSVVDYGALVDPRRMSHAGEPVGRLIELLGGRAFPPPGQRAGDRTLHAALEPLVETYAFVLSDALDTVEPPSARPWVEIARLWEMGEAQPAWVELLRARRYVVESDGAGTLRVALPWTPSDDPRRVPVAAAGRQAWDEAWPVLRHVFAAERRRLAGSAEAPALTVRAYPYAHSPERSLFLLGTQVHEVRVDDTRATGDRPPLDLAALQAFLDSGWVLEGGKLDPEGRLTPLASRDDQPASLLGRKLTMADLAVAFRAASHGGRAEPYMSLDPGYSPWMSLVNYGGRLRDTSLGLVSLLCDVRFKTFSTGLGIYEGRDMRATMREDTPSFQTHMERFAADPTSGGVMAQQTRLWFYPDAVDLTVSAQSDVLAMRSVRMTAASERVVDQTLTPVGGPDPPWTRATLAQVNGDYDSLAATFGELRDLDQVIRLLSLFTWLDQAAASGAQVPDLEALLVYELPELRTPRMFPQMLAFEALPAEGREGVVESFDRVPVADALDRLNPRQRRMLDSSSRYARALGGLDRQSSEEAAFLDGLDGVDPGTLTDVEKDLMAYRAQRLRMHRTVLGSLEAEKRDALDAQPERPRVFSVAVGGLDLGMGKVLDRARSRSIGLLGAGTGVPRDPAAMAAPIAISAETRARWREEPAGLPVAPLPDHGADPGVLRAEIAGGWIETVPGISNADGPDEDGEERIVYAAGSSEYSVRRKWVDGTGRPIRFERHEDGRWMRYTLVRGQGGFRAQLEAVASAATAPSLDPAFEVPQRLAMLEIDPGIAHDPLAPSIRLRLRGPGSDTPLEAAVPRWVLQRLVLGREADLARDPSLPGIAPFPPALGDVDALMVVGRSESRARPWEGDPAIVAGEQDPMNVAAAVQAWWDSPGVPAVPGGAVVGIDPLSSPARWADAPKPGAAALLVLPSDGFTADQDLAGKLRVRWTSGRISDRADPRGDENLVVVVSAEPPGRFAERLRAIAARPEMRGKLLAGWSLGGPLRDDLPAWILDESDVAGVGIAGGSIVGLRTAPDRLFEIATALAARGNTDRVESIPGPFLWVF